MACELTGVGLAPVGLLLARRLCGVCALPRVHVCTYSRTCVCGEDGGGSEDGPRWLVRGHAWACAYAYAYACACAMRCTGMQCRRSGNLSVPVRAIAEPADPAAVSWASPPASQPMQPPPPSFCLRLGRFCRFRCWITAAYRRR